MRRARRRRHAQSLGELELAAFERYLRVSGRSVERRRRAWREGGTEALASTGPAKYLKLSDGQFTALEQELALRSAEHGWRDQRWNLARRGIRRIRFSREVGDLQRRDAVHPHRLE
ncbi:hypothetical protein AB0D91_11530 [Streptomyces canus]|uniref:hypothetical protein n=1 Tax=Streptomyces canus TaxID=58343 RepID=UPI0033FFE8DF